MVTAIAEVEGVHPAGVDWLLEKVHTPFGRIQM